jgi:hypothetical protein
MSNFILTPLMNLPNPVPGTDPGPDYADNLEACFDIIDGHNHSVGSGNQINPSGIVINADLPFASNNATLLRSVRFIAQGSPLSGAQDLGCLYEAGVDLYYNDGSGNQVRITSGGTVNATSSGIVSGTASAAFSSGTLVVDQNTNTPGNIQAGSILIGNNVVSSNFVTLSAHSSLASNYNIVLPLLPPSVTSTVEIDTSGNMTSVAPNAVFSSSSGNSYTTTSGTFVTVTNLSNTLTTLGRVVDIVAQGDPTGNAQIGNSSDQTWAWQVLRDGSTVIAGATMSPGGVSSLYNNFSVTVKDLPTAGSHTYAFQVKVNSGATLSFNNMILVTQETGR